ncbi:unnamed protein product [Moneuplotes crassus]|uniref:Uncharacterized protein n=1 Tax=Euplotes crassus TaxID=5936 RepID=A0AAD2CXA6_EUPCR|nr:unnamed protein product [Moneuplotes crassus]
MEQVLKKASRESAYSSKNCPVCYCQLKIHLLNPRGDSMQLCSNKNCLFPFCCEPDDFRDYNSFQPRVRRNKRELKVKRAKEVSRKAPRDPYEQSSLFTLAKDEVDQYNTNIFTKISQGGSVKEEMEMFSSTKSTENFIFSKEAERPVDDLDSLCQVSQVLQ